MRQQKINFEALNKALIPNLNGLLHEWLPGGVMLGHEYTALNPTRVDRSLGSFRINIQTGRWGDFATGDRGGDVISLYAYLNRLSQYDAAKELNRMVGITR